MKTGTDAPTSGPPTPGRRPLRWALLVPLGLLLALCGAEFGLRLIVALHHPPLYELHERLGWRHAPGLDRQLRDELGTAVAWRTDSRGLRATPFPAARTLGRARALFVGDSFTEGSQVTEDDLFTVRVARAVTGIEAWNAAVGAWGTVQELFWLQDWGMDLRPDLVVLVMYDNDLQDNLVPYYAGIGPRPHARVDAGGRLEIVEAFDIHSFSRFLMPAPGRWWLYQHSALYRSIHKNLFLPYRGEDLDRIQEDERRALPKAEALAVMDELLQRMEALVRAGGARLAVTAIPTREQAAAGSAPEHAWIQARCAAIGVPFLSLLDSLAPGSEQEGPCYFARDIHLTRVGHRRVAEALAPFVRANLP